MRILAVARPAASRSAGLRGLRGRARPHLVAALPLLLLLAAVGFGLAAWRIVEANRTIDGLRAGRDLTVTAEAAAPVLLARIQYLAQRDRTEEAEAPMEALERTGTADIAARGRYALANARLRKAFGHLERGDLDPAGPLVTLARQDYRRALIARPDFWDAKFNLDVASRLLRDFPEFERQGGDDLKAEPKKIWTEIPGQPRGAP